MSAAQKPEPTSGTALATQERPKSAVAERIDATRNALKERNALVAAIRGTQWGKDVNADVQRAVAHYCYENGLDPVRHVELLGGRIYLTAEFYDERGAPLIRAGTVRPDEPEMIHADERLEKLAAAGDEWAKGEITDRLRARIQHAVPETAKAAVVQRFRIDGGAVILGVNWVGGGNKRDPVGDAEPTKTALTRARRRAWKQIADVIPGYGELVKPAEATARIVSEQLPVAVIDRTVGEPEPRALAAGGYDEAPSAAIATSSREIVADTERAMAATTCGRCGEPHAYKDGEDLGNDSGTCFRFAAAKEG